MVKALIVDDEAEARASLRTMLERHAPDVQVLGEAASVNDAQRMIGSHDPDLLLLDVQMPGGDGFELLRRLGKWNFDVIFITGSSRHAIQAIRFSALDYLVKPVLGDELRAAVDRHLAKHAADPEVNAQFLHNIAQPDERTMKLTLTSGGRTYAVPPDDIAWCEAERNYTALHLHDERRFLSARTLKEYDEMLAPFGFIRVHKSALVNRRYVDHLDRSGFVVLRNGTRVEVASRRREEVARALAG
jgi:two-component system LytT family response regulator